MSGDHNMNQKPSIKVDGVDILAEVEMLKRLLFQAQNAAIGLTAQLEIYENALESIILCQPKSLEATKAKQALAQVRGVVL
jgi:hypothetical protein